MANLPLSEANKLGVTVNGGHFDGRVEHVPIKKRRFVYRSPSSPPPPVSNSTHSPENDMPVTSEGRLDQESLPCQDVTLGQTVEANVDVNLKKLKNENDQIDANEDFSGISILANAACSIDLGQDEEFQWDLNKVGPNQLDFVDLDRETDAVSECPDGCDFSDKLEKNEAMGSLHLSETCYANQSGVTGDAVADQVRTSGHDSTDIVIPQKEPASSLGGIQVQETCELKMDYDSEYEDGELIESIEHTWEEYDFEDGEAEHVSYGSDDVERFGSDAVNRDVSMSAADCKMFPLTDINRSSSVEVFSLKNVNNTNVQDEANIGRGSNFDNGYRRLLHAPEFHRKYESNNVNRTVKLNVGQVGRDLLPKSCKSSFNWETRVRGFLDRRNIEGKVFDSRAIKREFQTRVNNSTNNGMPLREVRVQASRFNAFNDSKSRYAGDWNAHKSFRPGSRPSEYNWRQTRNSTDRPIKRVRSPSGSPTLHRGRYTREYQGRFDDRDSHHTHHIVGRERSFSPAGNPKDSHSNRPYRRNPVTSHDFRSQDRMLNLRSPHLIAGYSQRSSVVSDRRFPTKIISSDEAYGVSDSPRRVNQNNYSRPKNHERFSRIDRADHRFEKNDYDQRHGYGYRHSPNIRRHNSDDDFEIIHFVDRDDFSGAAMRSKEERTSFFHRRDREINANSK